VLVSEQKRSVNAVFHILYKLIIHNVIMKSRISKTEAKKQIDEFFLKILDKNKKEVKKIKRLAMKHKIPLGEYRKTFCKKCLNPYLGPSISVKKGFINITCDNCENKSRWKVK